MNRPLRLAIRQYRARQYKQSVKVAAHAACDGPDGWKLHAVIGWSYFRLGEQSRAIEHFRASIDRNPDGASALFGMFSVLSDIHELAEASQYLDQWRAVKLDVPEYCLHASWLAIRRDNREEAIHLATLGLELRPKWPRLLYCLGYYYVSDPTEWELADEVLLAAITTSRSPTSTYAIRSATLLSRTMAAREMVLECTPLLSQLSKARVSPNYKYADLHQYCLAVISDADYATRLSSEGLRPTWDCIDSLSISEFLSHFPFLVGTALHLDAADLLLAKIQGFFDSAFVDYYAHELLFARVLFDVYRRRVSEDAAAASKSRLADHKSHNYQMSCISQYFRSIGF